MRSWVVAAVVFAVGVAVVIPAPAAAQEPGCVALIDGTPATAYGGWREALAVDRDDVLVVEGRSPAAVDRVSVHLLLPLLEYQTWSSGLSPAGSHWRGVVALSDVADLSAGLHHLEVRAGACRQSLWIDVGRSAPLTAPVAIAGMLVVVASVAGLVAALRAARAGRRRLGRSAVAGAAIGVGALVVTNQLGWVPLTAEWLTSWIVVPGAVGALLDLAAHRAPPAARAPAPRSAPTGSVEPPAPASAPATPSPSAPPPETPSPAMPAPSRGAGGGVRSALPGDPLVAPAPEEGWAAVEPPAGATDTWTTAEPPTTAEPAEATAAEPPAAAAGGVDEDPPRESYARLAAPETVVVGDSCTVTVGLSPVPVAGVSGPALVRPATSVGAYDLMVQLVADGFTIADEDARRVLRVTPDAPYPSFDATLVALPTGVDVAPRAIQAIFSIDGQTIGFAVRPIAIVANTRIAELQPPLEPAEPGVVGIPTREHAADLTIHIVMGADRPGRLLWTVIPADTRVPVPAQAVASDIGVTPESFAKKVVQGVGRYDGQAGLFPFLRGTGLDISEHVPVEITDVLTAAAALVPDRPLTVFLVSEEPYVPWELAVVEPPLWPGAPPFLGAQVELGRWVFGQRRPTLPPPLAVEMRSMAVVSGVYDGTATRLLEAEAEAAALAERYGAVAVEALTPEIIDCLGGQPPAEVLHFAVHGLYDSAGVKEGLVLLDGSLLDPLQVKGSVVHGAPFVFLNACQVGSGNQLLGDYAGVAQSFLYAGAAAVIAPLWSVSDRIARELALAFYEATLDGGASPAAVLREMRARFDDNGTESAAATFLAYQLFGHPCLRLARTSG